MKSSDTDSSKASQFLDSAKNDIEQRLKEVLPIESDLSQELVSAMRYSVLNGGKRLRGLLVCATSEAFNGQLSQAVDCAAAIELVHAYSLVHDDLPAMDDAETRRGKPSCHVAFGEDIATLVGDALQPLAFEVIMNSEQLRAETKVQIATQLANAAGWQGMVGGQAWDVRLERQSPKQPLKLNELRKLQRAKTGALFVSAVEIGYYTAGSTESPDTLNQLRYFAGKLGECFQVVDDVLDQTQCEKDLGKPVNRDEGQGKSTLPSLRGLTGAQKHIDSLYKQALITLSQLGIGKTPLSLIAHRCVKRVK